MRKMEIKLNLEKIAFLSCTIAAFLLAIEIVCITVLGLQNPLVISLLVFAMTIAILICLGAVSLQMYLASLKEERK